MEGPSGSAAAGWSVCADGAASEALGASILVQLVVPPALVIKFTCNPSMVRLSISMRRSNRAGKSNSHSRRSSRARFVSAMFSLGMLAPETCTLVVPARTTRTSPSIKKGWPICSVKRSATISLRQLLKSGVANTAQISTPSTKVSTINPVSSLKIQRRKTGPFARL